MEIIELQSEPVVSVRVRVSPAEIGPAQQRILLLLFNHLNGHGVEPAGPPFMRYHRVEADELDLEIGMAVPHPLPGTEEIVAGELAGGKAAWAWHVGPYDRLPEAQQALRQWIASQGLSETGPLVEFYWTDPCAITDPAKWKTKLVCPVG